MEINETGLSAVTQWLEIKTAVRANVHVDPLKRYCSKTGQPIGAHDESTFIAALDYCTAEIVQDSLANSQMGCAPQWLYSDSANLDSLAYYDASGFIVYCLAQFARPWFEAPKVKRADIQDRAIAFYWAKARAFEIVSKMQPQAQTELANELVAGLSLEREVLAMLAMKLPQDCRAPDTLAKAARLGVLIPLIRRAIDGSLTSLEASYSAIRNGPSNLLRTDLSKRAKRVTELDLAIAAILNPGKQTEKPIDMAERFARFASQPLSGEATKSLNQLTDLSETEIDLSDVFRADPERDIERNDERHIRRMSQADYMRHAQAKLAESNSRFEAEKQDQLAKGSGISILNRAIQREPMARDTKPKPPSGSILNRFK